MSRTIYIHTGEKQTVAVVEDGHLCEYLTADGQESAAAEAIYLGRVERVVPGMKAAFIDIGQEKNGFLPIEEKSKSVQLPPLQSGMAVMVQIKKEAQGTKGAFLTRDVTLCGQHVILMPQNRYIGVSARIEDSELRARLQTIGHDISGGAFGLVMRTSAVEADEQTLREEVDALREVWTDVAAKAPTAHVPSLLHKPRTLGETVLDDYLPRGIDCVHTNDDTIAKGLTASCNVLCDDGLCPDDCHRELEKALGRFVWLKSGGSLVIDACEAMTVIDVNTGKFTGKRLLEDTILKLNLEACGEIARQARLRNLGGIIVIDFIDMASDDHRAQVQETLTAAFFADRIKTVIHGFTSLGLMELTRKKSRPPLREILTKTCPACHGTGRIPEEENHG